MASNVTDQSTKRLILTALLRTKLVGSGKPTEVVYDEAKESFQEQVCVVVEDDGIEGRKMMSNNTLSFVWFHYRIHIFVLWSITLSSAVRSVIEKNIADVLSDNLSTANWSLIEYTGITQAEIIKLTQTGPYYRHEEIPIRIQVYDNLTP